MNQQQQGTPSPYVNQSELALLKRYFKDNDELLLAMRAVMFNLDPTDQEKQLVKETFANDDIYHAICYRFFPSMSKDVPIGQVQDVWLGVDQEITGQPPQVIEQYVTRNEMSHSLVELALARLRNPELEPPELDIERPVEALVADPLATKLLARNRFIRAIESQLMNIKIVANQQQPPADAAERNSAK